MPIKAGRTPQDAIFHADGSLAQGRIALCEVQGYVYAAKRLAARGAVRLGKLALGAELDAQADKLAEQFEAAFWCADLGTYALALDGQKRPCRVRTSNAGQVLFSGIATPERAEAVMRDLMRPSFFSGWGIRTVAREERRYNPMSYHNGSGLAARQFADRRRPCALRAQERCQSNIQWFVRSSQLYGLAAIA